LLAEGRKKDVDARDVPGSSPGTGMTLELAGFAFGSYVGRKI
jgi:hypothetical protein